MAARTYTHLRPSKQSHSLGVNFHHHDYFFLLVPVVRAYQGSSNQFSSLLNSLSMLRISSLKNRVSPVFNEKSAANRDFSRASSSGIFLPRADDAPQNSASANTFGKKFGEDFDPENSKKRHLKKHGNSAFIVNNAEINSNKHNGYFSTEISSSATEFSVDPANLSQNAPGTRNRSRITRGAGPTSLLTLGAPRSSQVGSAQLPTEAPRATLFPSTPAMQNQEASPPRDVEDGLPDEQHHQGTYSPAYDEPSPMQRPDESRQVHGGGIQSPSQLAARLPSSSFISRSPPRPRNRAAMNRQANEQSQSPPRERIPLAAQENDIRRNFHPDLGPLTKVLDVPFELLGSLCGTANPIRFIPEKLVERTRVLFTTIIKRITDHHDPCSDDPQLLLAYKKLFFFVILISNNAGKSKDIKTYVEWVLDLISRDDWDSFTLGGLQMRSFHVPTDTTDDDRRWKASKSLANGRLSKGYQEWVKPRSFIPQNDDVFDSLCSLFPEPGPSSLTPEEQQRFQQRVAAFENAPQDVEPASIDRVGKIIMSRPNLIKSGFDHLTPEFVKKCWGMKSDQRQVDFRKVFTLLINLVRSARIPPAALPMFRDTEAFAIPKKDGKIRPLGTCNFIRKIAGVVALKLNSPHMSSFFRCATGFRKAWD